VRLSPGHFTRAFRETFGETPIAYVARRRMRHAQVLGRERRVAADSGTEVLSF
jgi:AraC-like DNA-binding protein